MFITSEHFWNKLEYVTFVYIPSNFTSIQVLVTVTFQILRFCTPLLPIVTVISLGTTLNVIRVFSRLHKMGMKVNLLKTEFFKDKLEYLGYLLAPQGIKSLPKKVEAIRRILPLKNRKQLRCFLGMVDDYWDMWKRWSHVLSPLSKAKILGWVDKLCFK